jgi:hypothetical protein
MGRAPGIASFSSLIFWIVGLCCKNSLGNISATVCFGVSRNQIGGQTVGTINNNAPVYYYYPQPTPSMPDQRSSACVGSHNNVMNDVEIIDPQGTALEMDGSNCNQFNNFQIRGASQGQTVVKMNNSNLNQFNNSGIHYAPNSSNVIRRHPSDLATSPPQLPPPAPSSRGN